MYPFEATVIWVAESETRLEMLHGGRLIKERGCYTDYYGYLRSIDYSDSAHLREMKAYSVDRNSTLEMLLKTKIIVTPYIEDAESAKWNRDATAQNKRLRGVAVAQSYLIKREAETADTEEAPYKRLKTVDAAEEIVWSSKNTEEQNENIKTDFCKRWAANEENNARMMDIVLAAQS